MCHKLFREWHFLLAPSYFRWFFQTQISIEKTLEKLIKRTFPSHLQLKSALGERPLCRRTNETQTKESLTMKPRERRKIFISREYNYFRPSAKCTTHKRAIMINLSHPQKPSFCQTLNCNNTDALSQTTDQATPRCGRKLFFAAETFSDRLAYWRARTDEERRPTGRRQKSNDFCRAFPTYVFAIRITPRSLW